MAEIIIGYLAYCVLVAIITYIALKIVELTA